eukprot:998440-Prymnesium_polylepis.1
MGTRRLYPCWLRRVPMWMLSAERQFVHGGASIDLASYSRLKTGAHRPWRRCWPRAPTQIAWTLA